MLHKDSLVHSRTLQTARGSSLLSIIPPGPGPPPPPANPFLALILQRPVGHHWPSVVCNCLTPRSKRACALKKGCLPLPLTSALVTAGAAAGSAALGMPRPHTYVMTVRMISTILQHTCVQLLSSCGVTQWFHAGMHAPHPPALKSRSMCAMHPAEWLHAPEGQYCAQDLLRPLVSGVRHLVAHEHCASAGGRDARKRPAQLLVEGHPA